jgi:hypothetical protein
MEYNKKKIISTKTIKKKILQDKYIPKDYDLKIIIHGCKNLSSNEETAIKPYVEVEVN